jgi:hypothetical protein
VPRPFTAEESDIHNHVCAEIGKNFYNGSADTARASGDDGYPTSKL